MKDFTLNWHADKFKKELIQKLMVNAQDAGDFVATDARRRLLAQKEMPKWEKYRAAMVAKNIDCEIEFIPPNIIEIRVGVKTTDRSKRHGLFIELGRYNHPANPFLRPAVFNNSRRIVQILLSDL
jgi:hypothetical protein